jgi:hypothetical protein
MQAHSAQRLAIPGCEKEHPESSQCYRQLGLLEIAAVDDY